MARLWEDGFDHYGSDTAHMLDGSYATVGSNALSTAQFATGNSSILITGDRGLSNEQSLRWVLPTTRTKMGVAMRVYPPTLPSNNSNLVIADFCSSDPKYPHVSAVLDANGAFRFYRNRNYFTTGGENGTLIATSDPVVVASAWSHVEVQIFADAAAGWVRVAVNGIHVFEATGLNTLTSRNTDTAIYSVAQSTEGSDNYYIDDYYIYDFTGTASVDTDFCPTTDGTGKATGYIGELQVWPLFPNGDTTAADWAKSTGTDGYALIDEHDPNDADYIYSTAAGDLSEFDLDDLPVDITYIRGLGIHARMSKSDSGAAMLKLGMDSSSATTDAAERPVTVEPTYWVDQVNVDPNSSARWTRDSLNAAQLRLTRSV